MAVKFFGQFLVERGVVSRESLLQAITLQESTNKGLGEIVVEMGMMTQNDAERINQAQRSMDLRFGDLAVQLGLLNGKQVADALAEQKRRHLYIGEALIKVGALTSADLEQYLADFKTDQAEYVTDHVIIPAGVRQAEMWEMIADLTFKMLTRVTRLIFRTEPCRRIDRLEGLPTAASLEICGSIEARYILAATLPLRQRVTQAILGENDVTGESEEVLADCLMEFVNVVCGNVVAKAAQLGQHCDIRPPETLTPPLSVPAGRSGLLFPIVFADGERAELLLII